MDRSLQITYLSFIFLFSTFLPAKEKWKVSAEVLENDKINNVSIQRLNKNVRFVKENKILLTDNAIQYKKDDKEELTSEKSTNVVVIKLKNASNVERKIILTYTQ